MVEVYEGSPLIITFFFSVFPKIISLFLLHRIFRFFFLISVDFSLYLDIIFICGLLSIFVGSISALYQLTIKRMLAASGIANMGFMLIGFCGESFLYCVVYYFFIYLLLTFNLFLILCVLRRYGLRYKFRNLIDFMLIQNQNRTLSFCLVFCLFSLAGLPPLIGFFGKFAITMQLIYFKYYFVALYVTFFSVLISVYYFS